MNITIGPPRHCIDFNFTLPKVDNIGVFFSGGLDSTALLCLIIEDLRDSGRLKNTNLYAFTMYKPTGETDYAPRILDLIRQNYNVVIHHDNHIPNKEPFISLGRMDMEQIELIYRQFNYNIQLYLAGNNMPPKEVKDFGKINLRFIYSNTMYYTYPFINLLKPQMIDIFYKLGIDFLIPYTHSCSQQYQGRCNVCWSCTERRWGFELLGIEDPATIDFQESTQQHNLDKV